MQPNSNAKSSAEFCPNMIALVIGALGLAALMILHPAASPTVMATDMWRWVHLGLFVCSLLIVFGVFQFAFYMKATIGGIGITGFALTALGAIGLSSIVLIEGTIVPVLSANPVTAPLLADNGPLFDSPLGLIFLSTQAVFALGSVLLAIGLVRGKTLPTVPSVLLVGGVLAVFDPPLPHILGQLGGLLWGVGMAWLSWATMRTMR